MTEDEWDACADPLPMLEHLRGRASVRKFRLFGVACCRKIESLILKTKLGYRAVVVAERMADGLPVDEDLPDFRNRLWYEGFSKIDGFRKEKENNVLYNAAFAARNAIQDEGVFLGRSPPEHLAAADLLRVHSHAAWAEAHWQRRNDRDAARPEAVCRAAAAQVALAHDVFGNPFPSPSCAAPMWAAWNDGTARKLAQAMYDERRFTDLLLLADVLEDAGCSDDAVLGHLRGPGPHVRGCWVVDLLLGKS